MPAQLYYTPYSCGAASYISAFKAGVLGTKINASIVLDGAKKGVDFYTINPKGNVPTVVLDDGTLLNENAATLQYIAELNPSANLAPANGTSARYSLQSKLNWLSSELHGRSGPLFTPKLDDVTKTFLLDRLKKALVYLNDHEVKGKKFLVGSEFTVADAYAYIILTWHPYLGYSLDDYPNVKAYFDGIKAIDFVQKAHAEMNANAQAAGYTH